MSETRSIYCCQCADKVDARLTDGKEIYPHRPDLYSLPFWRCDSCQNYVGCHHKTKNRTNPLGCIPNAAIKNARQYIHKLIDPMWQSGQIKRNALYRRIGDEIGRQNYHTAHIRTVDEARKVYAAAQKIAKEMQDERQTRYVRAG